MLYEYFKLSWRVEQSKVERKKNHHPIQSVVCVRAAFFVPGIVGWASSFWLDERWGVGMRILSFSNAFWGVQKTLKVSDACQARGELVSRSP